MFGLRFSLRNSGKTQTQRILKGGEGRRKKIFCVRFFGCVFRSLKKDLQKCFQEVFSEGILRRGPLESRNTVFQRVRSLRHVPYESAHSSSVVGMGQGVACVLWAKVGGIVCAQASLAPRASLVLSQQDAVAAAPCNAQSIASQA